MEDSKPQQKEPGFTMYQAPKTIAGYMIDSIAHIDKAFGDGYAKSNPELVGAFIQACALDYLACRLELVVDRSTEQWK